MHWYKYFPNSSEFQSFRLPKANAKTVVDLHYESTRIAQDWSRITVEKLESEGGSYRLGDFPALNDYSEIPIFSERAWGILRPLIEPYVEALPVEGPLGHGFFIINVLEII